MTDLKDDSEGYATNETERNPTIEVPDIVVTDPNRSGASCLMQQICYCGVQACHGSDTGRQQNLGRFG